MSNRLNRRAAGLPDEPLSPEDFATFMADCIASNDDKEQAREEGLKLMGALLTDLGYAEGVLIYGQLSDWYEGQ